jgi:GTP cyclohydrolase II
MEGSMPMEVLARYSRQVPVTFARVVTDREENILTLGDETTESFFAFTGFTRRDVERAGGKMRFLQGRETSDAALGVIRAGLKAERPVSTVLLNYTKSGSPFWNIISIRPCLDRVARPAYVASMCLVPVGGLSNGFALTRRGGVAIAPQQCVELLRALTAGPSPSRLRMLNGDALQRHQTWPTGRAAAAADEAAATAGGEGTGATTPSAPYAEVVVAAPQRRPGALRFVAETMLPTTHGMFRVRAYRDAVSGAEPIAFVVGNVGGRADAVHVRVHDQCVTSEVFGSLKCDCKQQLDAALERIQTRVREHAQEGGMLIYLPQEGRGIGLANKIAAYDLQTRCGLDTVDANRALGLPDDARTYSAAADILAEMNVQRIALMTNNPRKVEHLVALGVDVARRIPHHIAPLALADQANAYVRAKVARMGHLIEQV